METTFRVAALFMAVLASGCAESSSPEQSATDEPQAGSIENGKGDHLIEELTYSDTGSVSQVIEYREYGIASKATLFAEDGWEVMVIDFLQTAACHDIACLESNRVSWIRPGYIGPRGDALIHGVAAFLDNTGVIASVAKYDDGQRICLVECEGDPPHPDALWSPLDGCAPWVTGHPLTAEVCDSTDCEADDALYPSGAVKRRDIYCGDAMVHSVWFLPTGMPVLETAWGHDGDGMEFELDDNGRVVSLSQIRLRQRHGSTLTLNAEGKFAKVQHYDHGKLIGTHEFTY